MVNVTCISFEQIDIFFTFFLFQVITLFAILMVFALVYGILFYTIGGRESMSKVG